MAAAGAAAGGDVPQPAEAPGAMGIAVFSRPGVELPRAAPGHESEHAEGEFVGGHPEDAIWRTDLYSCLNDPGLCEPLLVRPQSRRVVSHAGVTFRCSGHAVSMLHLRAGVGDYRRRWMLHAGHDFLLLPVPIHSAMPAWEASEGPWMARGSFARAALPM